MPFKGKKVLITGGAGFIGSNLAIRLVNEGAEVTLLDSMLPDYGANLFNLRPVWEKVHLNISDLRDVDSLSYLIREQNFIFNLAGQTGHQESMNLPLMDLDVNVKGHLYLLEACRQYNPAVVIVYTSTRQIYGQPQYLPVDEAHPVNPPDINGINKYAAEQYHALYAKVYGLKTVSLRLTNTYGPRQLIKNAKQGFIGWFLNRVLAGESIKLFGTGEQIRDFTYVDDVVEALLLAGRCEKCSGGVYNLSGQQASLQDIAKTLVELTGGKSKIEIVPFPKGREKIEIGNYYGTSHRFCQDTGWEPQIDLREGLARTIEYYKEYQEYYL